MIVQPPEWFYIALLPLIAAITAAVVAVVVTVIKDNWL